jgi:hypothetical protein
MQQKRANFLFLFLTDTCTTNYTESRIDVGKILLSAQILLSLWIFNLQEETSVNVINVIPWILELFARLWLWLHENTKTTEPTHRFPYRIIQFIEKKELFDCRTIQLGRNQKIVLIAMRKTIDDMIEKNCLSGILILVLH